jgi:hypothetical protein
MRKSVWIGVGAAATVVVLYAGRRAWKRYAPQSLAERAETAARDVEQRAHSAAAEFRSTFKDARKTREAELMAALLADGQDASVQQRSPRPARPARPAREKAAAETDEQRYDAALAAARSKRASGAGGLRSAGGPDVVPFDDEEAELGYSF